MKKYSLLFSIVIVLLFSCLSISNTYFKFDNPTQTTQILTNKHNIENVVYICTGRFSKKYHSTPDCKGLNNCKGDIREISEEKAIDKGRTPCKLCL
jgi:hypothetical protein